MAAKAGGLIPQLRAFINSPTGLKTTHFWGPVANWGFVVAVCRVAALYARSVPPELNCFTTV